MRTEFRSVIDFPKYEVGDDGSVWSLDYNHTGKRKEMRQYPDKDGYPYVYFVINKRRYKRIVHRLIAQAFISAPVQVNHKNGKRNDNRVENLEWVTHQENVLHGWRVNGRKASDKARKTASKTAKLLIQRRWKNAT